MKNIPVFFKSLKCRLINSFKFSVIIILLTQIHFHTSNAQWNRQSPYPTHLDIRGVGAPTVQRVFIATDDNSFDNGGALFESNDGGLTWTQLNVPISLYDGFNGLFFLDNQNGWAFGNDNYRTTNGGTTWTQLPFLGSTYFMKFYTTTFGLATGNFDRYVSHDGGDSWVTSPNSIFAFDFIDNLIGLGVSETGIYRTTDGGNNFNLVQAGDAESVVFLSGSNAVSLVDGNFYRSTDGGVSWNPGVSANGKSELLSVSSDVVIAYGRTGTWPNYDDSIFRSSDAGQSWTNIGEVITEGIFAFTVNDLQFMIASDFIGNMFRSTDLGITWTQTFTSPGQIPTFLSSALPHFADAQTGYFGYGNGFVIKTTDAGTSWFQISSGTGESLHDVTRFSNGKLLAVGDNGTLLTSDGLSQWIIHKRFSQNNLKALQVIGADEAVLVDETGQVFKSTDGGISWSATQGKPSSMSSAEDIHFTTSLDGWVIGQSFNTGALYHTTDGGTTWTPVTEFLGSYRSVDVEGSNIWAANVGEVYYRSTDNGVTWIQGALPWSPVQISDMDFFNESIGYAVGWWGQAYRSSDGGITWEILPTPNSTDNFTDIHLLSQNELWISTTNDVAYYSATGGQSWSVMNIGSDGFGGFSSIVAFQDGDAWTVGDQGYIEHFAGPPPPPVNQLPNASFDFSATGLTVDFIDTSVDPDGFIVSWVWDFGDGTGSTQQHPSHTFDNANTYHVRLTVTDDDGDTGSRLKFIAVQPNPGGTFGDFTEVTPIDSIFVTPEDEDFWVITTAPADYDSDGDLDIAVLGYYVVYNQSVEDRLLLLVNNGPLDSVKWNFHYETIPLDGITTGASDMAWGDADGDGDLDLAVGSDDATVIYRNDAGVLNLTDTILPGYWEDNSQAEFDLKSIAWVDFDNDADYDLLIPSVFDFNTFSFRTALMRNDSLNGTGGFIFTEVDSVFAATRHASSMWADFDNDSDLDLLLVNMVPNTDESFIKRYRNDSNGSFFSENILGSLTVEHGEVQWGDYDADGDLDILVAGNIKEVTGEYNLTLRIYKNDNDTYVPIEVIPCIPCEGWFDLTAATWADYDSDGDMDILLAGNYNSGSNIEGRARIYTNNDGIFTPDTANTLPAPRASGTRGGTFSWFDIDGEGDLDYFIAGQYFVPGGNGLVEAQMHVYRNDSPGQNEAPSTPSDLNAAVQNDGSVLLSWVASSDDHTPTPALTYDIKIVRKGTHTPTYPGDNLFFNITRLPEPGNISAVTEWALYGLEDGIYDWSIRAVDAAYVGSILSAGTFQVGTPTLVETENNLPAVFSLEQNYPNPFNPTTTISFSIPSAGFTSLKVYDVLGKEVASLVSQEKLSGSYTATFNASSLSSGTYFYKLQSGSFVETKKMLLIK